MALVVDASVGLKWALQEPDSHLARALADSDETLLVPDFWLHEACTVLWLQVRKGLFTPEKAREGSDLLCGLLAPTPTPTWDLQLYDVALDIGVAVSHSTYDTLYVAFAIAMGVDRLVVADGSFVRDMRRHPDRTLANVPMMLGDGAAARGIA